MIATYAIKILEKEIDQTKLEECSFSDTDGIGDLGNFQNLLVDGIDVTKYVRYFPTE